MTAAFRIRNWSKFQHFKDRRPPWVKLYRDILDDIDWHELDPMAAKVLVMLWLIASEDDGNLPDKKQLAFRLRITMKQLDTVLEQLSKWVESVAVSNSSATDKNCSSMISSCYQTDAPETETETEKSTSAKAEAFADFWDSYPKKRNKGDSEKAWKRLKPDADMSARILAAVEVAKLCDDWRKDGGKYIPYPASWLNAKGWEDDHGQPDTRSPTRPGLFDGVL